MCRPMANSEVHHYVQSRELQGLSCLVFMSQSRHLVQAHDTLLICAQEKAYVALAEAEKAQKKLALYQFRRLKQLGTGDVGLVDLVELQGTDSK
jgi:hypothetical protein